MDFLHYGNSWGQYWLCRFHPALADPPTSSPRLLMVQDVLFSHHSLLTPPPFSFVLLPPLLFFLPVKFPSLSDFLHFKYYCIRMYTNTIVFPLRDWETEEHAKISCNTIRFYPQTFRACWDLHALKYSIFPIPECWVTKGNSIRRYTRPQNTPQEALV